MHRHTTLALLFSFTAPALGTCPGHCSGHGNFNVYSRCECWNRFGGADCNEHHCPLGVAWADKATGVDVALSGATAATHGTECSNRGTCDRASGKCSCKGGFEDNASLG